MEIRTDSGPKARNWRAAALPMARGLLYLVKADFVADALGSFREAFDEFTKENLTPEQAAWALWCETASRALADSLRAARVTVLQTDEELQQAIAAFLGDAFEAGAAFGERDLIDPINFEGYQPVRDGFPDFLRRIDPEMPRGASFEPLRRQLDNCLRRALVQAWSGDLERYGQVTARLEGPVAEGAKRQGAWMRHYGWIRGKFENAPVFSPDDLELKVKLRDVYVSLRCVRHEEVEEEDAGPRAPAREHPGERKKRRIAHVRTLHEEVQRWLDAPSAEDEPIRIVAGGPGSGKSSFARAFACDTLRHSTWRVILIELQHMKLSGDLRDDLAKYFQHRSSTGAGFYDDPLRWRAEDTTPHLLIFDGLDELARSDVRAADLTRRFIDNLKWMLRQSSEPGRPIKALVLGRSSAAEEGRKQAELSPATLLHALPLRPPTRRDLALEEGYVSPTSSRSKSAEGASDILDPEGLLAGNTADQRPLYWALWSRANLENSSGAGGRWPSR